MENVIIDETRHEWACRQEQIERALKRGRDPMPIDQVTDMLEEGSAQAWFAENSTVITEIYERGDKRICKIWLAGGNLEEVMALKSEKIEPWAIQLGCDRMLIAGRDGWHKLLPDYDRAGVILIKELD